jgi:hypothetical protein
MPETVPILRGDVLLKIELLYWKQETAASQGIWEHCLSVWVGDCHNKQLWRRRSDMGHLRSWSSRELGLWRAWWLVALPLWCPITWGLLQKQSSEPIAGKLPASRAATWALLPGSTESSEPRITWISQPPPPYKMAYCWAGSESTESSRQSTLFPWFSPSCAGLSAPFASHIVQHTWGTPQGLDICHP